MSTIRWLKRPRWSNPGTAHPHARTLITVRRLTTLMLAALLGGAPVSHGDGGVADPVRITRFQSSHPDFDGRSCLGVVIRESGGIPETLLNLGHHDNRFCHLPDHPGKAANQVQQAFEIAETLLAEQTAFDEDSLETLEPEALATRLQSPVKLSRAALDEETAYIIGAGLNYQDHRQEVGRERDSNALGELLVFPKSVQPTGAYADLPVGYKLSRLEPENVRLLDYELELGILLLKDIHLDRLPDTQTLLNSLALVQANDLSDREPIIVDDKLGFTQGKSHPGYLPLGPWLTRGGKQTALEGRDMALSIRPVGQTNFEPRQRSNTGHMIWPPEQILQALAQHFREGRRLCMTDSQGKPRFLYDANGRIPAGSLILTGTPGGTAFRKPTLLEKVQLFVSGDFSVDGARQALILEQESSASDLGYLKPGDQVEGWIAGLGTQRWRVIDNPAPRNPVNRLTSGACPAPLTRLASHEVEPEGARSSPSPAEITPRAWRESGLNELQTYQTRSGEHLNYRAYPAKRESAILVYLHGIESHGGWFDTPALALREAGYTVYALDRRGSGLNRESMGFPTGHADDYELLHDDISDFLDTLPADRPVFLVGLSWGGKLAYTYSLRHPGRADGLILITPGLAARVDVSLFTKAKIGLSYLFSPRTLYDVPIEPEMFTTTPEYLRYIQTDPLRNTQASAAFLLASSKLDKLAAGNRETVETPVQLFLAGGDRIIDNQAVTDLLEAQVTSLEIITYPDQTHSIQFDAPERLVDDMVRWLQSSPPEKATP